MHRTNHILVCRMRQRNRVKSNTFFVFFCILFVFLTLNIFDFTNNIFFVYATTDAGGGDATGMPSSNTNGNILPASTSVGVDGGPTTEHDANTIDKTNNNYINNIPNDSKKNNASTTTTTSSSTTTTNSPNRPSSTSSGDTGGSVPKHKSHSTSSSSGTAPTNTASAATKENISSSTITTKPSATLEPTKNVTSTKPTVKKKKRPYIAAIPMENDDTRMNYAAKSAGAVIIDSSKDFKYVGNILDNVESNYALVPCASKHKYVTISLSGDSQVDGISLKNAEAYSGTMTDVQVLGSAKYPTKQWTLLGEIKVENNNNRQSFKLPRPAWINFVKLRFRSHYGDEFYCTLTRVVINGQSMMDAVQKTLDEASFVDEDDDEELGENDDKRDSNDASSTATTATTTSGQNIGGKVEESRNNGEGDTATFKSPGNDEGNEVHSNQRVDRPNAVKLDTHGSDDNVPNSAAANGGENTGAVNEVEIISNGNVGGNDYSDSSVEQSENIDTNRDNSENLAPSNDATATVTPSRGAQDPATGSGGSTPNKGNYSSSKSPPSSDVNIHDANGKNYTATKNDKTHRNVEGDDGDSRAPANDGAFSSDGHPTESGGVLLNNATSQQGKKTVDSNTRSGSNGNHRDHRTITTTTATTTSSATKAPVVTSSNTKNDNQNNKPGVSDVSKNKKKVAATVTNDKLRDNNDATNIKAETKNTKHKKDESNGKNRKSNQPMPSESKGEENKSKIEKSSGNKYEYSKNNGDNSNSEKSNSNTIDAAQALEAAQAKQKELARNEEKKSFNSLLPTPPTLESKHKKIELPRSGAQIENIFSTLSKKVSYVEKDERQLRRNLIDSTVGYNTIMNSFNEKLLDSRDEFLIYKIRTKIAEDKIVILENDVEVLITWCKILSFGLLLVLVMHLYLLRRRKLDSDNLSIVVDEIRDLREV